MSRRFGRHRGSKPRLRSRRSFSKFFIALVAPVLFMTALPQGAVAQEATEAPPTVAGIAELGLNFEASRLNGATGGSTFIPPDTMGAVGPNHIVEMINGNYQVFDKGTGASLEDMTLDNFWTARAGLPVVNNGRFDPRVVYDPTSERWFAVAIDNVIDADNNNVNEQANNVFVARTDSDDPTGDWDGVSFDADAVGIDEFHDYPTLGIDADGLYSCTQDFDNGGAESCYSIPKADLLLGTPSAARLTRFEATPAGLPAVSGSWQPAIDFGLSDGRAALLGSTGTALRRTNIFGSAGAGATIGPDSAVTGDPGHAAPPAARQPDDSDNGDAAETLENVAPRFVGNVFELGNSLWAVHAVLGNTPTNSALRWYEINETTNTVIQTGLIDDPNRDFHEPTIAANSNGDVVIGYSCSGPNLAASVCVSLGQTNAGVTGFQAPAILQTGDGPYYRDFCAPTAANPCSERNRWGDYSATVIDPTDPCSFWVFQEYTAQGSGAADIGPGETEAGLWGIRAAEMTFIACAGGGVDLQVRKDAPANVAAGEQLTYTITVTNQGGDAATNVVVTDQLPAGVTLVSTAPACTQAGQTLTCPLGGMLPAQTRTVSIVVRVPADFLSASGATSRSIENTASASADQTDVVPGNNSDGATTTVGERADMAVSKLCREDTSTPAAIAGTCDIFVDNFGPSDAQNVKMVDEISSSSLFTVGAVTVNPPTSGTCTVTPAGATPTTSKTVTCDLGTEAALGRTTVTVQMSAAGGGDISDSATVSSSTPDPQTSNNRASGALSLSPRADLVILKTANPSDPKAGETITYNVTVTNEGPSPATNVVVEDELPGLVTFVSATPTQGQCGPANGKLRCNLGTMASGETDSIVVVVGVPSDTPDGTVLANKAIVHSDVADPDNSDNLASAVVRVKAVADLILTKASEGAPIAGTMISYRYTIDNDGPSWAQEVALVDQLPEGITFVKAFLAVGGSNVEPLDCDEVAEGSNKWSCPLGDMGPTQPKPLEVVVNALIDADVLEGTPLANHAEAISDTFDSDGTNNRKTVEIVVQTLADLVVVKTSDFDTYGPSATIKYTITVTNYGPSDSQGVIVYDDLPETRQAIYRFDTAGCTKSGLLLTCSLGKIASGATKSFNVYVTVKGSKGQVVNVARVISQTTDPDTTNNRSVRTVLIQGGISKK